jgi:hypothetical protein
VGEWAVRDAFVPLDDRVLLRGDHSWRPADGVCPLRFPIRLAR